MAQLKRPCLAKTLQLIGGFWLEVADFPTSRLVRPLYPWYRPQLRRNPEDWVAPNHSQLQERN